MADLPDAPCLPPIDYIHAIHEAHERSAVRAWQDHVDAGRIGVRLPRDPAIAANLARTDAIFRGGALFRRQQRAGW